MTTQDVAALVESIGLPYCYYQFEDDPTSSVPNPPFVAYYYTGDNDFKADDINYVQINQLVIELYTDDKRFDLENLVRAVLTQNGLAFDWVQSYIEDEHMYMTTYTMEVCIDGPGGE